MDNKKETASEVIRIKPSIKKEIGSFSITQHQPYGEIVENILIDYKFLRKKEK